MNNQIKTYSGPSPLKVLMIGNSFSLSCRTYLPAVATSVPGCNLKLEIAYIGGCSLERHIQEYKHSTEDATYRPYTDILDLPVNLQDLLARDSWDIISIQQASHLSWDYASYQPWADQLIDIIKATNPQAEIVIQQTWAYNSGDPRIADEHTEWKLGQAGMHHRLIEAYANLARHTGFRLIPVGTAVAFSRENHPLQFPADHKMFIRQMEASYPYPMNLPYGEDAVGNLMRDTEHRFILDTIHLNPYGEYMQACVWFAFLFNRPVCDIPFYPPELKDRQRLDFYRQCAQKAILHLQ